MPIPAYIIDQIQKQQRDGEDSVFDELHIHYENGIPGATPNTELNDSAPKRGGDEIDFFF